MVLSLRLGSLSGACWLECGRVLFSKRSTEANGVVTWGLLAVSEMNESSQTEQRKSPGLLRNQFKRLRGSPLCRREAPIGRPKDAIGWWESRRIPFNLIVGIAGILSCIVVGVVVLESHFLGAGDFDVPDPPLLPVFGIIFYAIAANVCFTGGWLAELAVRTIWPHEADRFATMSFSLGVVFSVLFTLTPGILFGIAGIFALLGHFLGVVPKPL